MFNPLSSYNPDSQPLGHFKNYPVYLATVVVAVHVVSMLAGVVISPQSYGEALAFSPNTFSPLGQPWRWITYSFVHVPRIWFLLEMYLLFSFARDIEANFGRKVLIRLYAALILLPPLLMALAYYSGAGNPQTIAGSNLSTFCLFMGICLMHPGAPLFGIPWLTYKVVGPILLGMSMLTYLAARDWTGLVVLLSCCVMVYKMLRSHGLPQRFEAIKEALQNALPARQAKTPGGPPRAATRPGRSSGSGAASSPSKYYEPKIKPKADLAPERKAVEEVDAILDKIARSGMDSLTAAEKAALQKASSRLKDTDF